MNLKSDNIRIKIKTCSPFLFFASIVGLTCTLFFYFKGDADAFPSTALYSSFKHFNAVIAFGIVGIMSAIVVSKDDDKS